MNENFDHNIAIEELKSVFERQRDRFTISRDISKSILGSSTVIVSVLGGFSVSGQNFTLNWMSGILIGIGGLAFLVLVAFCIDLLLPVNFNGPIQASREIFDQYIIGKQEKEILTSIYLGYLNAIALNEGVLKTRRDKTNWAGRLLILVSIAMIGLLFFRM